MEDTAQVKSSIVKFVNAVLEAEETKTNPEMVAAISGLINAYWGL